MGGEIRGKVVVITGGAAGIGLCLAREFGAQGATVALLDLDEPSLQRAVASLHEAGIEASAHTCDVCDAEACEAAIAAVVNARGGVDILINNAGITHRSAFVDTAPGVFRKVVEVNLFGTVNCTRAALPHLIARRGTVVALSSVAGFAPLLGRTAYCASKHALHGFLDTLRAELAPQGVGVLLVCPSFTSTGMDTRALDGKGGQVGRTRAAVGKQMAPETVAQAVLRAVQEDRRRVVLSAVGKASWWLSRVAPRAYEWAMVRSQREDVDRQAVK